MKQLTTLIFFFLTVPIFSQSIMIRADSMKWTDTTKSLKQSSEYGGQYQVFHFIEAKIPDTLIFEEKIYVRWKPSTSTYSDSIWRPIPMENIRTGSKDTLMIINGSVGDVRFGAFDGIRRREVRLRRQTKHDIISRFTFIAW